MIDSHAHVDTKRFDSDRDAVLARARAAGVRLIVNVGCDLAGSERSVALAEQETDVYATVGIHPRPDITGIQEVNPYVEIDHVRRQGDDA